MSRGNAKCGLHRTAGERTHRRRQGFARHGFAVFHKEPNIFAMGGQFVEYALVRLDLSDFDEL